MRVDCSDAIKRQLSDHFSFLIPDARWHPAVKSGAWDGIFRLYNPQVGVLYLGLLKRLAIFCRDQDYHLDIKFDVSDTECSLVEAQEFFDSLRTGLSSRDYQIEALAHIIRKKRAFLLSPTASGKSMIIYTITKSFDQQTLVILPKLGLVEQLEGDFADYGNDPSTIQVICGDYTKEVQKKIVFATWQSIFKLPRTWFEQFQTIIVDEGHGATAASLTSIMEKSTNAFVRVALSGTLDGETMHTFVLEGLFGPVKQVTTTAKLIESGIFPKLKLKCIVLKYPEKFRKMFHKAEMDFAGEKSLLANLPQRNRFIGNLAMSLKGNTLILFQHIDHGEAMYKLLVNRGKKVYIAHGGVDVSERERIRGLIEKENNIIVLASYGTFGVGTNMKNLHNVIAASAYKAIIATLQAIGRGLRRVDGKDSVCYFDITDDLSWKSKLNHTFRHYMERLKIYQREKFDFKSYDVALDFPEVS